MNLDLLIDGYYAGIAYSTGYIANDAGKKYLVVRNLDLHYPKQIADISGYNMYTSACCVWRDKAIQYVVKARNVRKMPVLSEIKDVTGFCRAYIEIHSVLDRATRKDRKGNNHYFLRLRIYGNNTVINYLNDNLPVTRKAIQHIVSSNGQTFAIYFQSKEDIDKIISWIDGYPKNQKVWDKWNAIFANTEQIKNFRKPKNLATQNPSSD